VLPPIDDCPLARAARVLVRAEALLITAGAGMGVDSGLPDFAATLRPPPQPLPRSRGSSGRDGGRALANLAKLTVSPADSASGLTALAP
jgi:hypothetical protein